jgi:hypothetical protein
MSHYSLFDDDITGDDALRLMEIVGNVRRRSPLRGYERRDAVSPSVDRRERKPAQQPDY